jgi:hypothetical protein
MSHYYATSILFAMAQRSNPLSSVRRKFARTDFSTGTPTSREAEEDVQLPHNTRHRQNPLTAKKLLLCVDYGTTLTSISYITFNPDDPPVNIHPSAIRSIANWPNGAANRSVPSKSWYRYGKFLWGHKVQHTLRNLSENDVTESLNSIVQLPKLLLDDDGKGTDNDRLSQPRKALRKVGRTPRGAIGDYLMEVFKHTQGQLGQYEAFNDTWEVELVLCVPSNWSTYARLTMQEIMIEVVEKTDMRGREFSIYVIEEPEAAVTFALRHENIREDIEVRIDDSLCLR